MKQILFLFLFAACLKISYSQNSQNSNASLHARNYTLGSQSPDTLYAQDLKVKIPGNGNFSSCRLTLESLPTGVMLKDTTYTFPANDIDVNTVYSISRSSQHLIIRLDSFSLLQRHKVKLVFIKSDGSETTGADLEF